MEKRQLIRYAIWFSPSRQNQKVIERALNALWKDINTWAELRSDTRDTAGFRHWLQLSNDFYLLYVDRACSPGDISGFIKGNELIGESAEVIALLLDSDAYVPDQGLVDGGLRQSLADWVEQTRYFFTASRR